MKKKIFSSGITYGSHRPDIFAVREWLKNDPVGFFRRVDGLVNDGKLGWEDFQDLKTLFRVTADVLVPINMEVDGIQRAIMASAFPVLTGTLAIKSINDAYQAVPTIGQELVTDIDDNKKTTTIAAVYALDNNVAEVKPGDDYPEIGASEESVQIRNKPNGRRMSIHADTISENNVADITMRLNALGRIMSDWVEEQTLERVTDDQGSKSSPAEPYVYRPNGTGTALYSASANTPGTRAPSGNRITSNALVDETDIEAARVRLATMKDNRGKRITIPWSTVKLLCPDAVVGKAAKVFNSEYVPGVENEVSNYGPMGRWHIPPARLISSPKMDDLSSSAWYLGAFQSQFVRKWKLRMEYVTLGQDTQAYLMSRIAFQARVAWDVEIGATDYNMVVQNLSASTAPGDE